MIIPRVDEESWLTRLSGAPVWRAEISHALIVSPHPDDETLGAGGFISSLARNRVPVTVAAVTDGENAYEDSPGLAATRQAEQTRALARLGVKEEEIHRFHLPDSDVGSVEEALEEKLGDIVKEGMHVLAPWPKDFHPDHEACGRAALKVAKQKNLSLSFYFFWTWHRGDLATLDGLDLVRLPLSNEDLDAKAQALQCHRSQLQHSSGSPILPSYLLGPVHRPFEVFLPS